MKLLGKDFLGFLISTWTSWTWDGNGERKPGIPQVEVGYSFPCHYSCWIYLAPTHHPASPRHGWRCLQIAHRFGALLHEALPSGSERSGANHHLGSLCSLDSLARRYIKILYYDVLGYIGEAGLKSCQYLLNFPDSLCGFPAFFFLVGTSWILFGFVSFGFFWFLLVCIALGNQLFTTLGRPA